MILIKKTLRIKRLYLLFFIFLPSHNFIHSEINTFATKQESKTEQIHCYCDICTEVSKTKKVNCYMHFNENSYIKKRKKAALPTRTFIVYMAADNNLSIFAARNIREMASIGSNENITIVVHLDIRVSKNKKITRRYIIEKNKILHVDPFNTLADPMDSGNPATLISCCEWAIRNFNADTIDFVAWNHGTGALEPSNYKIVNPMDLFIYNQKTRLFELDRSIGFMDTINEDTKIQRGVCWDDTTGNYLTNRQLDTALQTIRDNYMNGKKFGIIGFDACLMGMIEIASFIKKHADVMVGSQELELGLGWKYDDVLAPFEQRSLNSQEFGTNIVAAYKKMYQSITNDYTLSAIDLSGIEKLEANISDLATLLMKGMSTQKDAYNRIIKESRNRHACTHFDEPSYIDIHHFYTNLASNIKKYDPTNSSDKQLKNALLTKLNEGIKLIDLCVIANTVGPNLKNAHGISIYFPERNIHSSYKEAFFLEKNHWGTFLPRYLFG